MKPKVSFVIPTLNAALVLEGCLRSISIQDYPKESIEIVIADGGSTDKTIEIAKKYGALIYENKLKTGEAGKAVGVKNSTGKYIALVDSDNILPDKNWLNQMIDPLERHQEAVGSEPWEYTWRKEDGFIDRYCALIGMNDPFVHFLGNYDRVNILTGKWTQVLHDEKDLGDYLFLKFDKRGIPTIGANGTVLRKDFLADKYEDYLFDIDVLSKEIKNKGFVYFVKVKNGIIHNFCGSDIKKFSRKQKRRVSDFLFHKFEKKDRDFNWESGFSAQDYENSKDAGSIFSLFYSALMNNKGMLVFLLSCVTFLPLVYDSIKGYIRKSDSAWFFHPLACEITFYQYSIGTIKALFVKKEANREGWKQ